MRKANHLATPSVGHVSGVAPTHTSLPTVAQIDCAIADLRRRGHDESEWAIEEAITQFAEPLRAAVARIAELEASPWPEECRLRQCTYFNHYLAYGPADLTHEGFHAAEVKCEAAQRELSEWMKAHECDSQPVPAYLERIAVRWEKAVRA